jgi:hypothetical protein
MSKSEHFQTAMVFARALKAGASPTLVMMWAYHMKQYLAASSSKC